MSMLLHALLLILAANPADSVVKRGFAAIGGEDRWRAVKTLQLVGRGITNHIGDSEWFTGPYFIYYFAADEWRDVAGTRRSVRATSYNEPADTSTSIIEAVSTLDGTKQSIGAFGDHAISALAPDTIQFLLQPEHVLFTALAAPDLHRERDTVFRYVTHNVVSFHIGRAPVRLFFEAESGMLRMVEVRRAFPYSVFWNAWGDVTERIKYSDWSVEETGIWYPRQIDTERNGLPDSSVSYGIVHVNATPATDVFDPPATAKTICGFGCILADSVPLGIGGAGGVGAMDAGRGAREIAPGIVQIVGAWNSTLVRQDDGIVIIEAPISAGYGRAVIAEAQRRYPGLPIKGVVSTTDFWWHVAGLREYVARGIPIYILDRNVRVVMDRVHAPHTLSPDDLARAPRAPIVRPVAGRVDIGVGENAIRLLPFHTEQLDRMLMVYLPNRHIVYTAEGIQLYPTGLTFPQTAIEVANAVKREGLTPETFIGMHVAATPWSRLVSVLDSLERR
jgi:hypothetical protein